jgi:peptidoglycan/xylan/chitin deacetylase (PgdA/CDA1 family)
MRRLWLVVSFAIACGLVGCGPAQTSVRGVAKAHTAIAYHRLPKPHGPYNIERCGNQSKRGILTFDDWAYSDPQRAVRIGRYLQKRGIRAAFFLIDEYAQHYPGLVRTLRAEGHWVGNHSYSHPNLALLPAAGVRYQIKHGLASNTLRPPDGSRNATVMRVAGKLGYRVCLWTIDTGDWHGYSAWRIVQIVKHAPRTLKVGGVILGHLFTHYPDAIPGIIAALKTQHIGLCRNNGPVGADFPFPLDC